MIDFAKEKKVEGVVVPLSTPLNHTYDYDRNAMNRLLEHVIKGGVQGVFVLGLNGEFASFSDRESLQIVEHVTQQVNGRVTVYANATRNSTINTQQTARNYMKAGVDYIVLMTPFFMPVTQDNLKEYVSTVAEVGPVMLYNNPRVTGTSFEPETVFALANERAIAGIKDSSDSIQRFKNYASIVPALQGNDRLFLRSMNAGGKGAVSGLANIVPNLFFRLYAAALTHRQEDAQDLNNLVTEIQNVIYKTPSGGQAGIKQALSHLRIARPIMRPPQQAVTIAEARRINTYLDQHLKI